MATEPLTWSACPKCGKLTPDYLDKCFKCGQMKVDKPVPPPLPQPPLPKPKPLPPVVTPLPPKPGPSIPQPPASKSWLKPIIAWGTVIATGLSIASFFVPALAPIATLIKAVIAALSGLQF